LVYALRKTYENKMLKPFEGGPEFVSTITKFKDELTIKSDRDFILITEQTGRVNKLYQKEISRVYINDNVICITVTTKTGNERFVMIEVKSEAWRKKLINIIEKEISFNIFYKKR
jgi:hypothetical protein